MFQALLLLAFSSTAKSKMDGFIVGGKEASIQKWPFITFIEVSGTHRNTMVSACGGSLLSSQTVLTAAHCLDDVTESKEKMNQFRFTIYMGHSTFNKATLARQVKDYQTPSEYDPEREDIKGDIGVMFLHNPVRFGENIRKVLLYNRKFNWKNDRKLSVAGWGKTSSSKDPYNTISPVLKHVKVESMSGKECHKRVTFIDVNLVVCAGKAKEFAYSGDSGGPLVKRGSHFQIGVVSFRHEETGVTVYTNVVEYYDWINRTQLMLFKKHC